MAAALTALKRKECMASSQHVEYDWISNSIPPYFKPGKLIYTFVRNRLRTWHMQWWTCTWTMLLYWTAWWVKDMYMDNVVILNNSWIRNKNNRTWLRGAGTCGGQFIRLHMQMWRHKTKLTSASLVNRRLHLVAEWHERFHKWTNRLDITQLLRKVWLSRHGRLQTRLKGTLARNLTTCFFGPITPLIFL